MASIAISQVIIKYFISHFEQKPIESWVHSTRLQMQSQHEQQL